MPRLQTYFECIARALCETGEASPIGIAPIGDSLMAVVRSTHEQITSQFSQADVQTALRETVSAPQETVDLGMEDAIAAVASVRPWIKRASLMNVLELIQPIVRQALRRPGDAAGTSVPQQLPLGKPEDWLVFFPDRLARFKAGERPKAYEDWHLTDLRGFGPYGEAWQGMADDQAQGTALLKFITDPRAAADFEKHEEHFRRILDLDATSGLVPLRSVYLLADPPCIESAFVGGYDLTGLIRDWQWRDEPPKPDQASQIIKRVARIMGGLHLMDPPIVHRGLKPSNILLHPTAEGKVTIWVSDIGWGALSSQFMLERIEQTQARRQARRGALATRYASPEQQDGQPADPRDDVYALGMIWYQLLKRDMTAPAPEGTEWAGELRKHGFGDGHARLLASCLDPDPDYRPANGMVLASQIDANFTKIKEGGLRVNVPKDGSEKRASHHSKHHPAVRRPTKLRNSLGMDFVLIEPGTFTMGSPANEKGRQVWEGPAHSVTITRPFYLSVYPVTQGQYQQLTGLNPSHHQRTVGGGPMHPVEQVSWDEASAYCQKLMELPNESAAYRIYRLPTEAEWEFACRAGTTTPFAFGEIITLQQVHFFGLSAATWSKSASTAGKTAKVDERPPNVWGANDMHGNVLEWCHEWFSENTYDAGSRVDPQGPADGRQKVVRGGSFSQFSADCRSAARMGRSPGSRLNTVGFRVAMTVAG